MKAQKSIIEVHGKELTTTSLVIAELFDRPHKNVLQSIDKVIKHLKQHEDFFYKETFYIDKNGDQRRMYELNDYAKNFIIQKLNGFLRIPHRLQEESALKTIEQLLGVTLIRQYSISGYFIDGYHKENKIAYEIDEPEHIVREENDKIRQGILEKILKCQFVRIRL